MTHTPAPDTAPAAVTTRTLVETSGHTHDCVDYAAYRAWNNYMADAYPSLPATQAGLSLLDGGIVDCSCDR